jgi:hypothetical protein
MGGLCRVLRRVNEAPYDAMKICGPALNRPVDRRAGS